MDKDKQFAKSAEAASPRPTEMDRSSARTDRGTSAAGSSKRREESDDLYDLLPELRPPKLSPEAIAAAMQAMQIDPDLMDAGAGTAGASQECGACGNQNRIGNKFCGKCGAPTDDKSASSKSLQGTSSQGGASQGKSLQSKSLQSKSLPGTTSPGTSSPSGSFATLPAANWGGPKGLTPEMIASASAVEPEGTANGTHHYHHHYHHHYFQGGMEGGLVRSAGAARDPEKLRGSPVLKGEMSRGEAAIRRVTQEWVLACNTKHLDDMLDLYAADAMVMRANVPPVRGAAAVREFFFNSLDSGLGEVEIEPLRVEVAGNIAYEAGKCKALVSGGALGKRREERGKYLWVLAKQEDGDWKLTADCWSSDLTLPVEPESTPTTGKSVPIRK